MWTDLVVLSEPLVDDDLCLLGCGEPFGVEPLVAQEQRVQRLKYILGPHPAEPLAPVLIRRVAHTDPRQADCTSPPADSLTSISRRKFSMSSSRCRSRAICIPLSVPK